MAEIKRGVVEVRTPSGSIRYWVAVLDCGHEARLKESDVETRPGGASIPKVVSCPKCEELQGA